MQSPGRRRADTNRFARKTGAEIDQENDDRAASSDHEMGSARHDYDGDTRLGLWLRGPEQRAGATGDVEPRLPEVALRPGCDGYALRAGVLGPEHLYCLPTLRLFTARPATSAGSPGASPTVAAPDLPAFSLVLMGPVLWTRFRPAPTGSSRRSTSPGPWGPRGHGDRCAGAGGAGVRRHFRAPTPTLSGLVRFYGDPAEIDAFAQALARAFPAGVDQASRGQGLGRDPDFR